MASESPSILDMFGDPWPREVTDANRVAIRRHLNLGAGRSPEVSAALIIRNDDVTAVIKEMSLWDSVSPEEASPRKKRVHYHAYQGVAAKFLGVEGYRKTGEIREPYLDNLRIIVQNPVHANFSSAMSFLTMREIEMQLLFERVGMLWEKEGPISAYYSIVDYLVHPPYAPEQDTQIALVNSGERFRQLYFNAVEILNEIQNGPRR